MGCSTSKPDEIEISVPEGSVKANTVATTNAVKEEETEKQNGDNDVIR